MVRSLYIIHPEECNWNQLIPDLDGGIIFEENIFWVVFFSFF